MAEADPGRAEKILDEDVRKLMAASEAKPISVLVEPDLPRPRVKMRSEQRYGGISRRPQSVEETEDGNIEKVVHDVGGVLEKVADEPPRWNELSRVFVVDTTTDRVETIARSPHVRRISLNRHLYGQPQRLTQ